MSDYAEPACPMSDHRASSQHALLDELREECLTLPLVRRPYADRRIRLPLEILDEISDEEVALLWVQLRRAADHRGLLSLVFDELPEERVAPLGILHYPGHSRHSLLNVGVAGWFTAIKPGFSDPLLSRREPRPPGHCGRNIDIAPLGMVLRGLQIAVPIEECLHKMRHPAVTLRSGGPIVRHQHAADRYGCNRSFRVNQLRIVLSCETGSRVAFAQIGRRRYRQEMQAFIRPDLAKQTRRLAGDVDHRRDFPSS